VLVTTEEFETRSEARKREAYLKSRAGIADRWRLFEGDLNGKGKI